MKLRWVMRGPIRRDCPPPPLRFFGYLTKHPVLSAMGEENCRYEQYTKVYIVQFANPGRKNKDLVVGARRGQDELH
uniref:hypothetical protein n=1 Tax=Ensifer adhaerens TaxID=106592 RepID=UPI000DE22CE3